MSEKPRATALAMSVGCKSAPPNVARGCANADSSIPGRGRRSRPLFGRAPLGAGVPSRRATGTASGKAPVQLLILLENSSGGGPKFGVGRTQQVDKGRASEIFRGQAEPGGFVSQFIGLRRREFESQRHTRYCSRKSRRPTSVCSRWRPRRKEIAAESDEPHFRELEPMGAWLRQIDGLRKAA